MPIEAQPHDGSGYAPGNYIIHKNRIYISHGNYPDNVISIHHLPSGKLISREGIHTSSNFIIYHNQVFDLRLRYLPNHPQKDEQGYVRQIINSDLRFAKAEECLRTYSKVDLSNSNKEKRLQQISLAFEQCKKPLILFTKPKEWRICNILTTRKRGILIGLHNKATNQFKLISHLEPEKTILSGLGYVSVTRI